MSRTTYRMRRHPRCRCRIARRTLLVAAALSSRPKSRPTLRLSTQRGQSMIEYVVVCAALVFTLGIGMIDDKSVLRQLLEAFRTAYEKFSFAISIPY